jgi:hypothetical protein
MAGARGSRTIVDEHGESAVRNGLSRCYSVEDWVMQELYVVIDPVGSLGFQVNVQFATKTGAIDLLFGAKHGDLPLERSSSELLADLRRGNG